MNKLTTTQRAKILHYDHIESKSESQNWRQRWNLLWSYHSVNSELQINKIKDWADSDLSVDIE